MDSNSSSSSSCESGENGKNAVVDPKDLRFTQLDISRKFSDPKHPTVEESVEQMKRGALNPEVYGALTVYKDEEGAMWCKNNRRLYVLRKVGVVSVKIKFTRHDTLIFKRLETKGLKEKAKDPAFLPRIRGTSLTSSPDELLGDSSALDCCCKVEPV